IRGRVVVDHAGDIYRQRVKRLDRMARLAILGAARRLVSIRLVARGTAEQIRKPATTPVALVAGTGRRRLGAPWRRGHGLGAQPNGVAWRRTNIRPRR